MDYLKPVRSLLSGATTAVMLVAGSIAYAADENVLPTAGDNIETYWSAKYWTIFKNTSRHSCFIEWRSENSVVQAGLTREQDAFYLGALYRHREA